MAHRPTLAEFVEQELRQAEPTFAAIADDVLKQWRERLSSRHPVDLDALRTLHAQRGDFSRAAAQSLCEQAHDRRAPATGKGRKSGRLELSLVDDDEITADIEVARVVERSDAELEEPLRELRTYTSALVGDVNSARDTNPLRPEAWVRGVLAGARSVAISRPRQLELLRASTPALIRSLHGRYGDACARLRAAGVTPAVHRTIVNEGVVTELTDAMRAWLSLERELDDRGREETFVDMTQGSRQVHPRAPTVAHRPREAGRSARASAAAGSSSLRPATGTDHHDVERLSRLYDAILSDRRLPRDTLPLVSRLYPAVLRQTLAEPHLLDDDKHPVWMLIDHVAFLVQTREVGSSRANMVLAREVIEQLVSQSSADARPFQSAANRLAVLERQRFARAVSAAASDIATLAPRKGDARDAGAPSVPQSLDGAETDSQPAPLLRRGGDAQRPPGVVADGWRAGSWLTIFLRSRWRRALVLWRAPIPGPLLLLDADEARHWALRSPALERLAVEGLARPFGPRSLMRNAAQRMAQPGARATPHG